MVACLGSNKKRFIEWMNYTVVPLLGQPGLVWDHLNILYHELPTDRQIYTKSLVKHREKSADPKVEQVGIILNIWNVL